MRIRETVNIKAPAETVWSVLTNLEAYEGWNPLVTRASTSNWKTVALLLDVDPEDRYISLEAKPQKLEAPRLLKARLLYGFPGLLGGQYVARIEPTDSASVAFIQEVTLSGWLRPLYVSKSFIARLAKGLRSMNAALKKRCESA